MSDKPYSAVSSGTAKHPPVDTIMDVVTFRLARLVSINIRAGQHWTQRLFDLSLNEWWLLAVTQAHEPVRAGDMAELLVMDKSQLSRLIKSLVARKLIKSTPDPDDARATILGLTPKGAALFDKILAEVLRRNENVLAPLSPEEVLHLSDLLARLTDHNAVLLQNNKGGAA
jgi:DNA-binding MarR family transcriptional regulator